MFERAKERYKNSEFKILIAKLVDLYTFCKTKNKIMYTDFLQETERGIIEKVLQEEHITNYMFWGGRQNADREILIVYPEKFSKDMVQKNFHKMINLIRITLPNYIKYEHREFLSGMMKLGIKREKFGDILITEDGADIITLCEMADYLAKGLQALTRFKKAEITILDIESLRNQETEFKTFYIIVSSLRLDNFVSELAKCSRTKAETFITGGSVLINGIHVFKNAQKISLTDKITIRGKGKFIFDGIERETHSGKYLVKMRKYQ